MDRPARPLLVALAGLPGAGKTTLARGVAALARATGIDVRILSRDDVRHVLFAPCDWTDDEKLTAFEAMLGGAVHHLEMNRWVVLEGMPFSRRREVDAVRIVGPEYGAATVVVECALDPEAAAERIRRDTAPDHQGREDGPGSAAAVHAAREAIDPDLTIDMSQDPVDCAAALFAALRSAGAGERLGPAGF